MAVCPDCNQEMLSDHQQCTGPRKITLNDGKAYNRNTSYFDKGKRCHDCNIVNKSGHLHHAGCDMERCPKCGGQLIACGHHPGS